MSIHMKAVGHVFGDTVGDIGGDKECVYTHDARFP